MLTSCCLVTNITRIIPLLLVIVWTGYLTLEIYPKLLMMYLFAVFLGPMIGKAK